MHAWMSDLRSRRLDERGDAVVMTVALLFLVSLFVVVIFAVTLSVLSSTRTYERSNVAQEAVDIAIAQALWTLNEDYGYVNPDEYVQGVDAYSRALPSEDSPANADLQQFNATRRSDLHGEGEVYGVQAKAKWWVEVFDASYDVKETIDPLALRHANRVGTLFVAAEVTDLDGETVFATRSIQIPLYQTHVNAVRAATGGEGLAYVTSPLSMMQYAAFGIESVRSDVKGDPVSLGSPVASGREVIIRDPDLAIAEADARRYEAFMMTFGPGAQCYELSGTSDTQVPCSASRTMSTGFEMVPDIQFIRDVSDYCAQQGMEDYIASQQASKQLLAGDITYCFGDFIMDADVRVMPSGTLGNQVARVFVADQIRIENGARFLTASGEEIHLHRDAPQVALFTESEDVTIEGSAVPGATKFYLYAPHATCEPGRVDDDPATPHDEAAAAMRTQAYYGSMVCKHVWLNWAGSVHSQTPFPELTEFGSSGFGSDLYPATLWFTDSSSTKRLSWSETS